MKIKYKKCKIVEQWFYDGLCYIHILSDDICNINDHKWNDETGSYKIIASTREIMKLPCVPQDVITNYQKTGNNTVFVIYEYNDHIRNKHIYTDMGYPLPFGYDPETVVAPTPSKYIGWFPVTKNGEIVVYDDNHTNTIPIQDNHKIELTEPQKIYYENEVKKLCEDAIYYGIGLGDSADKKSKIENWLKRNIQ